MMICEPKHKPRRLGKLQKKKMTEAKRVVYETKQERQAMSEAGGTFNFSYNVPRRGSTVAHIPSAVAAVTPVVKQKIELSEEMAQREKLAQQEIERKKLCVAPAYNKGSYQYIGSAEQAKDIGR